MPAPIKSAFMTTEEQMYWRRRADIGHKLIRDDPSVDPWEVLAAIVWPETKELEEAFNHI